MAASAARAASSTGADEPSARAALQVAPQLPLILAYHKVERRHELGVTRVSPRRFARHVERFARDGWRAIGLAEIEACARGERVAAPNEIAFTFDDAYRGLREHAFPILEAHGFTAVCSVITEYAGRLNRWDVAYGGRRFAHLAWRDMRRWQERGVVEFASHTATHPRLTWLTDVEVAREMSHSRTAVAQALDVEAHAVSYPFGAARARERRIARASGYTLGLDLAGAWDGDLMAIVRHPVYLWAPPMPGVGPLAPIERWGAAGANRCAVGTSLWHRMSKRA